MDEREFAPPPQKDSAPSTNNSLNSIETSDESAKTSSLIILLQQFVDPDVIQALYRRRVLSIGCLHIGHTRLIRILLVQPEQVA